MAVRLLCDKLPKILRRRSRRDEAFRTQRQPRKALTAKPHLPEVVAKRLLDFLVSHPNYSRLVVHGFSVGGYQFGEVLVKIRKEGGDYNAVVPRFKAQDGLLVGELGLVVLNEPASHTRIRLGACRDTSPNLAIWLDEGAIAWSNSFEDLGSHHRVLCLTVVEAESEVDGCQKAKIVDWDELRENREREKQASPIEDIGEWCRGLLADVDRVTKEIYLTDCRQEVSRKSGDRPHGSIDDGALELSRVDSPLAYDVEAKKSMQRRASEEKLYRKIRKKIADINLEIKETHCA
ncbi:hypothetical protein HPB51_019456 [Rhipicephalus microplus]|uniref:Uncharacterized protein n=1 Tax=Rhipicephalus microplus TaxID=6941 RepID=A0A9J6DWN8_RHIMP|nr:hypothetical protein HPB51_019456 [Rhipicephalus microplus]